MSTSIHAADVDPPLPQVTPWNAFYWTAGAEGVLRMQRCSACGRLQHPPASRCALCKSVSIEIVDLSGKGTVEAVTVNSQPWHPAFVEPYAIAIVALDEDRAVRLTTNVINVDSGDVAIGMPVRVVFHHVSDVWLPLFEPDSDRSPREPALGDVHVPSHDAERAPRTFNVPRLQDKFERNVVIS